MIHNIIIPGLKGEIPSQIHVKLFGGDGSVLFDTRGKNDEVQYGCNTCDKEAWFFGGRNPTST